MLVDIFLMLQENNKPNVSHQHQISLYAPMNITKDWLAPVPLVVLSNYQTFLELDYCNKDSTPWFA